MLFYTITEFHSSEVCLKVTTSKQLRFFILYMIRVRAFLPRSKKKKSNRVILQVELLFTCSDKFPWMVMQMPSFGEH